MLLSLRRMYVHQCALLQIPSLDSTLGENFCFVGSCKIQSEISGVARG